LRCLKPLSLNGRMPTMWLVEPDVTSICGTQHQYTCRTAQVLDRTLISDISDSILYSFFKTDIMEKRGYKIIMERTLEWGHISIFGSKERHVAF
jgi:hypothetical protein